MDTLELLLHPVRLRIVHALSGGVVLTTADLCARLPDTSMATVYRQVALLVDGGVLEVAGERRVHGAVERRFRLSPARPALDPARVASMSAEEHRAGFVAAMAALVAEFGAYLDREPADPIDDQVGYRQLTLWLSPTEAAELVRTLGDVITTRQQNRPEPGRRPYLLSPILFPIDGPSEPGRDLERGPTTR